MKVTFTRTIGPSEVKSRYINLTDDNKKTYGKFFSNAVARVVVVDSEGRQCNATRKPNQLWGNIRRWFIDNKVTPGMKIHVAWGEQLTEDGIPIVNVKILDRVNDSVKAESVVLQESDGPLQASLPLMFVQKHLQKPDLNWDSLETLDDWESWLSWLIRQVELIGEIDITEIKWRQLSRLIKSKVSKLTTSKAIRTMASKYPAVLATYLVSQGIFGYAEGSYWPQASQQSGIGRESTSEWGRLFEAILDSFKLPRFLDLEGQRYVSVILMHGGIPVYCLRDYFQKVLLPAVARSPYMDLASDERLAAVLERSEVELFTDKPIQRFLGFGGGEALNFFERSCEMFSHYLDTGEVSGAYELGLPPRVVHEFSEWVSQEEYSALRREGGERLHISRPQIQLDPWGDGVFLRLPSQHIPATLVHETPEWRVRFEEGGPWIEYRLDIRRIGYDLRVDEQFIPIELVTKDIYVEFQMGQGIKRVWNIPFLPKTVPVIAFDPENGQHVAWRYSLPAKPLWIMISEQIDSNLRDFHCVQEFPPFQEPWDDFSGGEFDLSEADCLKTTLGDGEYREIPIRPSAIRTRPVLVEGHLLANNEDPDGVSVYVGRPPCLRLPLSEKLSPEEDLLRWKIDLKGKRASIPNVQIVAQLVDLINAIRLEQDGIYLSLDHSALLGDAPFGTFDLQVRGPLGRDASFKFRMVPALRIAGLDDANLESITREQRIEFRIGTASGFQIEPQLGIDGIDVFTNVENEDFNIRINSSRPVAEIDYVYAMGTADEIRVPLFILLPHLRWTFVNLDTDRSTLKLTSKADRWTLNEFLGDEKSPWLRLEISSLGDLETDINLELLDIEENLLQRGQGFSIQEGNHVYRIPLGEFSDTLRAHKDAPLIRLCLSLNRKAPSHESIGKFHLLTLVRGFDGSGIKLENKDHGGFQLIWQQDHQHGNEAIRIWPAWRPWEEPLEIELSDKHRGSIDLPMESITSYSGRFRIEFFIKDPWVIGNGHTSIPDLHAPHVFQVETCRPGQRLTYLDKYVSSTSSEIFNQHFEKACLLQDTQEIEASYEEIVWCQEHLDHASFASILAMSRWLGHMKLNEHAKAFHVQMFLHENLFRLIDAYSKDQIPEVSFQEYLSVIPNPSLLYRNSAELLLDFGLEKTRMIALQSLLEQSSRLGVEYAVRMVNEQRLSEKNAIQLLKLNPTFSRDVLIDLPQDPSAMRLLQSVDPDTVPAVGYWVNTSVGWGRIDEILDSETGESMKTFVAGMQAPKLIATLRPGEYAEEVCISWPAGSHESAAIVEFLNAREIFTCCKCNRFSSKDRHVVHKLHDRKAHSGMGSSSKRELSTKRETKKILYSHRRPQNIWK